MDLFKFCRSQHFYFCLQGKKEIFFDDRTKSGIFLRAIPSSEYADFVTMLQSHIDLYRSDFDDGSLPYHLCPNGLSEAINTHSAARLRDAGYPHVHRASVSEMYTRTIQGYSLTAHCVDDSLCCGRPNSDFGHRGADPNRHGGGGKGTHDSAWPGAGRA